MIYHDFFSDLNEQLVKWYSFFDFMPKNKALYFQNKSKSNIEISIFEKE